MCEGEEQCELECEVCSEEPVRYVNGEVQLRTTDLASGGFGGSWSHDRVYSNQLPADHDYGNGYNWLIRRWPHLIQKEDGSIVFVQSTREAVWFDLVSGSYVGRYGAKHTLTHDATNEVFKLTTPSGIVWEFHDFDQTANPTGKFKSQTTRGGQVTSATEYTADDRIAEIQRSYTTGGSTTTESFKYDYFTSGEQSGRLQYVTLRRQVDAGQWDEIQRAEYEYYGSSEDHGSLGDLKRVKIQVLDGSTWKDRSISYYRYYKQGDTKGSPHCLKYVLKPQAYALLADAVADPLTATDAQVAAYADHYFEYDSDRRVTKEIAVAGSRTYTFSYTTSTHADGYNNWKRKTVETRPDTSQHIVYTNYLGQILIKELKSGTDRWIEYHKYNSDGREILRASPSAVTGYDDTQADLNVSLKASDGLIYVTDYYSTTGGGAAEGYVQFQKIKKGNSGTEIKLRAYEYTSRSAGGTTIYPRSKMTVYRNDDGTGAIDTSYSYTWYTGTVQIEQRTTTLPAVPTSQNGSGTSATRVERFDQYGNLIWVKDERGYITRHTHDVVTGTRTQTIEDVDTTQVSDEPSGWVTPSGGGLHLVTDYEYDDQGRLTEELGPSHTVDLNGTATTVRTARWTVYKDVDSELWTAQGYATGTAPNYTYTLVNPVSITKFDKNQNVLEEIQATRSSTSGKLQPTDSFPRSSYVRWTTNQYTHCCLLASTRVYHTIPASGEGSSGTNYDQTDYGYNAMHRRNATVTPGGTITFDVLDVPGNVVKTYVGTNDDGATESDPTGGGADPDNNMVLITENEYDGGNAGGDGNLTEVTQHVDGSTTRVTAYRHDWRNRQADIDGEEDSYLKHTLDNLDRVSRVDQHDTTSSGTLVGRSETKHDDRGRVYQTIRRAVDPATGTVGDALTDNTWFDTAGNTIKQQAGGTEQFTKAVHDGLGRATKQYTGFDTDETSYADAQTVTGDTIFEQVETDYDAAGNVTLITTRRRLHDATGTGELTTPGGSQPKARVSYTAFWHDGIGREIAQANYGDNGGSALTRPDTVPARSDTILVSTTEYNDNGEAFKTIDPSGKEDRTEFDDAGRQTAIIENYVDGDPTTGAADEDRRVDFTYTADGLRKTIKARQQSSADDQVTKYVYGTTLTDSDVARSDVLRAVIYPDSDDVDSPLGDGPDGVYDRVEHKYNRQGEIKETKDQNGSIHAFEFDKLGRQTHDRVTTLGTGVDGAVRRISTTFEVRGPVEKITSYDNAAIGSGNVVNEIVREYNDLAMLVKGFQEHGGAKNGNTPYVGYNYDESAAEGEFTKGLRLTSLRYADGRLVHHTYGTSGSDADHLNRLDAIKDDSSGSPGAMLAAYTYLGLDQVVVEDLPEPDIKVDLFGGTSGSYAGLDRFDRVIDQRWYDYGSSQDVDRFKYGYDRASNRTWKENTVSKSLSTPVYLDEFYTYDALHRLKTLDRGELNATNTGITGTPAREEDWTLDPLGNWSGYIQKTSGTTDLDQERTVNPVNEITDITETTGTSWITPSYDKSGNMVVVPRPDDLANGYTCTYDAWNRLVKVEAGISTVATYAYDALHRRVTKTIDSTVRHFYYSAQWQALEERLDSSTNPDRQYVWGPLYIDHLILRDRDTSDPPNGTLDERLYALQDANWNVTCLADTAGDAVERYLYEPYGTVTMYDATWSSTRSTSSYDNTVVYTGREYDPETGLYHYRNRYYDSQLGRFVSRDQDPLFYPLAKPLESSNNQLTFASGISLLSQGSLRSLYEYGDSTPLVATDPTGRNIFCGPCFPLPPGPPAALCPAWAYYIFTIPHAGSCVVPAGAGFFLRCLCTRPCVGIEYWKCNFGTWVYLFGFNSCP
ncbi:MAG: RHS repeat-associated core domain-containing protein [Pirellulaceae bacterium]|nr:RHS repeat-associated core domain-containing protein [Pirellulaceae bacterium]